jgi:hypothetical protein
LVGENYRSVKDLVVLKAMPTTHIELNILRGLHKQKEQTHEIKSEQQLLNLLMALDWQVFHVVTLSKSETDWAQIGGSREEDGLVAVYQEGEEIIIKNSVPRDSAEIEAFFLSYYNKSHYFKKELPYRPRPKAKAVAQLQVPPNPNYNLSEELKKFRCQERRVHVLSFVFVFLIGYLVYAGFNDELRFIGQRTIAIDAIVIDAKYAHFGKGKFYRRATYEYVYEGKTYAGKFNTGPSNPKGFSGCRLRVKVSKRYPRRSKILARYKSCNDLPFDGLELPAWLKGPKTTSLVNEHGD